MILGILANQLLGGVAPAPTPGVASRTSHGSSHNTTDANTWTFSNFAVNDAALDRYILVVATVIHANASANPAPFLTCTVEGNTPTQIAATRATSGTSGIPRAQYAWLIADSTHADVDIVISAVDAGASPVTCLGCSIAVYSLFDIEPTPWLVHRQSASITTTSDMIYYPANSVAIAVCQERASSGAGFLSQASAEFATSAEGVAVTTSISGGIVWTGLTEDDDDGAPFGTISNCNTQTTLVFAPSNGFFMPNLEAHMAVVAFTAPTSTGTFDITDTRLGGRAPVAALFFATNHVSSNDPNGTVHATFMCGATDGTNDRMANTRGREGVANSFTSRREMANHALVLPDQTSTSTNLAVADFSQWLVNGVRLNFTTASASPRRMFVVFFYGQDIHAKVGTVALGTGTSAIGVTGVGFEPDVLIAWGAATNVAAGVNAFWNYTFGIAINDGADTQKGQAFAATSDAAETLAQIVWTNRIGGQKTVGGAGVDYHLTVSAFAADGFDITPSANTSSDEIFYLALNLGGCQFDLFEISTPTSTGNVSYTAPGFLPQFALGVATYLQDRDTGHNDAQAGTLNVFAVDDKTTAVSMSAVAYASWFASGTHTVEAISKLSAAGMLDYDPTARDVTIGVLASFNGFDSDGFDLNYTTIAASAKMAFALVIEKAPAT